MQDNTHRPKKYALVMGVNKTASSLLGALKNAEQDAEDMAVVLQKEECGFTLFRSPLIGKEANSDTMKNAIRDFVRNRTDEDFLLLYFSGHGQMRLGQADEQMVYLGSADFVESDAEEEEEKYVSFKWLRRWLYEKTNAGRVLLILDCCFSGEMGRTVPDHYLEDLRKRISYYFEGPGNTSGAHWSGLRLAMTATGHLQTTSDEESQSLTHWLLPVLRGEVSEVIENDGVVSLQHVYRYLERVVSAQRPSLSGDWASRSCIFAMYPTAAVRRRKQAQENTRSISKRLTESNPIVCDVCVVCALDEEAEVFIRETSHLCHVTFKRIFGPQTKREYRYTTIQNNEGEPVALYITWLPRYGPEEMALHLKPVLAELRPRFAAMTGICAGDRERVALGDLIVADRAFLYDTGKIVSDKRGRKKQLYDTSTYQLHSDILQFVQMFDSWKTAVVHLSRPVSKRQQRDWLLNTLLHEQTLRIDAIPQQELEQHAPDWKKIVNELQSGRQRYLKDGMLSDPARVHQLSFKAGFPFSDPAFSKRHIAAMASASAVRSDNPFKEIQVPVRGAVAIDMEGAIFYRTVAEFAGLHSLLVKGVCDYADPDKDDSYHDYASALSAIYVLSFIKDYVTVALMPRYGYKLSTSAVGEIDQPPLRNEQESGQGKDMIYSIPDDASSTGSITLNKAQREQLHMTLLSAFPSRLDLKRMVDFGLDQNLDNIVDNSNLEHSVFELIKWAEVHNKVSELIRAAYKANSDNVQLRTFVSQMGFLKASDS